MPGGTYYEYDVGVVRTLIRHNRVTFLGVLIGEGNNPRKYDWTMDHNALTLC